jgi:hypothetical protein
MPSRRSVSSAGFRAPWGQVEELEAGPNPFPVWPLLWTCGHEADATKEGSMTVVIVAVVVMAVLVCGCVVFLRMRKGAKRG